jgi:hypothetical protein
VRINNSEDDKRLDGLQPINRKQESNSHSSLEAVMCTTGAERCDAWKLTLCTKYDRNDTIKETAWAGKGPKGDTKWEHSFGWEV